MEGVSHVSNLVIRSLVGPTEINFECLDTVDTMRLSAVEGSRYSPKIGSPMLLTWALHRTVATW